jgi:hypothetical protein
MEAVLLLCRKTLSLRFEMVYERARHQPYRVFDREERKTMAKFEEADDAKRFRDSLISRLSVELFNVVSTGSILPWLQDAPDVQGLQGEQRTLSGQVSLSAV